jgi:hypothetical protein
MRLRLNNTETVLIAKRCLTRLKATLFDTVPAEKHVGYYFVVAWLACKFNENQDDVQTLATVARCTGMDCAAVCDMEIAVLRLLDWRVGGSVPYHCSRTSHT